MSPSHPVSPEMPNLDRLKTCLHVAQEIQHNLLPQKSPTVPGLDISGASIYSCLLGGDFFDYMDFEEVCCRAPNHIGVVVGDVSDHGICAALLMSTIRAYIRSRSTQPGDIGNILTSVNRMICKDVGIDGHFVTLFYLDADPVKKEIRWVRAGHEAALLFDATSNFFHELKGDGSALGVSPDLRFEQQTRNGLQTGDIVLTGTDGVWEARNPNGEIFGKDRIQAIVRQNAGLTANSILKKILAEITRFQQSDTPEDDITLVVIKFT